VVAEQVPDIKKLFAPALGDWVSIFKAFARIKSGADSTPFLAESGAQMLREAPWRSILRDRAILFSDQDNH
jgi:hypothetical protein